jgi:hypothetical protein
MRPGQLFIILLIQKTREFDSRVFFMLAVLQLNIYNRQLLIRENGERFIYESGLKIDIMGK